MQVLAQGHGEQTHASLGPGTWRANTCKAGPRDCMEIERAEVREEKLTLHIHCMM